MSNIGVIVFHFNEKLKKYIALIQKNVTDNKRYWKTDKPILFNKLENGELLNRVIGTNNVLNIPFWNIVQIVNISKFPDPHPLIQKSKSPLREIQKTSQRNCY